MVKMGAVWDRTAEFLTDNLSAVLPVALFAFFVPASIQGNFSGISVDGSAALAGALTLANLAFAILALWGTLTLVSMAIAGHDRADAGRVATRRLGPAFLVLVVLLLCVCLLFAPMAVALIAYGYDVTAVLSGRTAVTGALGWVLAAYRIALAVVLVLAIARLAVVTPVVIAESRMLGAIPRAFAITRGHMLPITGVFLLYVVVTIVAVLAAKLVFGSVFHLLVDGDGGISLATVLTSVTTAAVQTGFTVLPPVFTAKLYLALMAAGAPDGRRA